VTEERDDKQDYATEVWRFLFIALLTVSAGIMAWGIHQVTDGIDKVGAKQDTFLFNFQNYVLSMEKRVTTLEDYQRVQDASRQRLEQQFSEYRDEREAARRRGGER